MLYVHSHSFWHAKFVCCKFGIKCIIEAHCTAAEEQAEVATHIGNEAAQVIDEVLLLYRYIELLLGQGYHFSRKQNYALKCEVKI